MRSASRALTWVLLFAAATLPASAAFAGEPKITIAANGLMVPTGSPVVLDATQSQSDKPIVWRAKAKDGKKVSYFTFDKGKRAGVVLMAVGLPDGEYIFSATASGDPKPDSADEAEAAGLAQDFVTVSVGSLSPVPPPPNPNPNPNPGPTPPPPPSPGPIPTDPTERKGYDYAKAVNEAVAAALGAAAMGRYESTQDLVTAQRKAFTDGLTAAFAPVASDLIRQVGEASSQPSARDVAAAQDYLKKIQAGVRAAK